MSQSRTDAQGTFDLFLVTAGYLGVGGAIITASAAIGAALAGVVYSILWLLDLPRAFEKLWSALTALSFIAVVKFLWDFSDEFSDTPA